MLSLMLVTMSMITLEGSGVASLTETERLSGACCRDRKLQCQRLRTRDRRGTRRSRERIDHSLETADAIFRPKWKANRRQTAIRSRVGARKQLNSVRRRRSGGPEYCVGEMRCMRESR